MKAHEWETIKRLFDVAITVPKDKRQAWLDHACAGSRELRETLEELLRSYDESSFDAIGEIEALPVFEPGQLIANRFMVVRLIARGGMGEVYEVQDTTMKGLRMALKTIRMDVAESKNAYEWFMREVWVGREIANENICHIFDFIEHVERRPDGSERVVPCLTMQLLEGHTLEAEIAENGPFAPLDCLEWIRQVARALDATHKKGFAHRDIKPSNIMLVDVPEESRRRAVVMDFGLAQSRRSSTRHRTAAIARASRGGPDSRRRHGRATPAACPWGQ
jgi:serine/threonine protein kinase